MSYGYAAPGPSISAWEAEIEQSEYARIEAWRAEEAAQAAAYAAAVEAAKEGRGFCGLAAESDLPFSGCWLPGGQSLQVLLEAPKSAEVSAGNFSILIPRAEVAARMVAAGEDPAWCSAWAERGYVGRANAPGGCNAQYRAFNERAEALLNAPEPQPEPAPEPEKTFTLADLTGISRKRQKSRK